MKYSLLMTTVSVVILTSEARSQTLHFRHPFERQNQCGRPCQREPYWITFDAIMELGNIPSSLRPLLRPQQQIDANPVAFDVGRCTGFCKHSMFPLYRDTTNTETRCIPIEFTDLKTEIFIAGEYIIGPTIQNLIIKSCACSEIQTCNA